MALNLVRNSRVFFTTNVAALTGVVNASGATIANTFEIQVLDGFSFSQNTNSETVTINEAGTAPVRGQRAFNTSLAPVDFSMSTYMRPHKATNVICEESVLWGALSSDDGTGWTPATTSSTVDFISSNVHQLQKFGLVFIVDNASYVIDNCSLNQATIDFGLDAIAMIAWTGQGTSLRKVANITINDALDTMAGGFAGTFTPKNTNAAYITNKLSTVSMSLVKDLGSATATKAYNVALTGGSITINNNINYITPANLGVINTPVTYYTGTRAISGSLNAYLKTGTAGDAGDLLNDMLAASTDPSGVEPMFQLDISIGGAANTVKVLMAMPSSTITIPSIDVQQVVSTAINFTAQGNTTNNYDLAATNELTVSYFHP